MGFVFKLCICSNLSFLNTPLLYCYNFAGVKTCCSGTTGDFPSGVNGALHEGQGEGQQRGCVMQTALGQHLREISWGSGKGKMGWGLGGRGELIRQNRAIRYQTFLKLPTTSKALQLAKTIKKPPSIEKN